ncbi:hypothetical protein MTO96_043907, partial [Rhipicephalus appendiculatus]
MVEIKVRGEKLDAKKVVDHCNEIIGCLDHLMYQQRNGHRLDQKMLTHLRRRYRELFDVDITDERTPLRGANRWRARASRTLKLARQVINDVMQVRAQYGLYEVYAKEVKEAESQKSLLVGIILEANGR